MANLSDMEELLHRIENEQIRDYMKEALTCYMTKAYRGCIVLSFIAMFDDINSKLEKLSSVNRTAKSIFNEIKRRRDEQEVYENYLIEQLKAKNLLQEIDYEFADILRKLRNKSAHPSGHKPSAEEARYVFFEVVDRFLSKPIFSTNHLVGEVIKRLSNSNFFVDTKADHLNEVVMEEISSLHITAVPLLVSKLLASSKSEDSKTSQNARLFISGLTYKADEEITKIIMNSIVKPNCDDSYFSNIILETLSLKPEIYKMLSPIYQNRIKATLLNKIKNDNLSLFQTKLRHPASTLKSLARIYNDSEFLNEFSVQLKMLFEKAPALEKIKFIFKGKQSVFQEFMDVITSQAGSSTFKESNNICRNLLQVEEIYKTFISDKQAFELVTAIVCASNHGANKAEEFVKSNFTQVEFTKAKAKNYISENLTDASAYFKAETQQKLPDNFL